MQKQNRSNGNLSSILSLIKQANRQSFVFTREECFIQGSPRHEMQVHVRLGADKNGKIRGIDLSTLSNTGAFGEHGPTTVDLSGTKSLSLYRMEAFRFKTEVCIPMYYLREHTVAMVRLREFLLWNLR